MKMFYATLPHFSARVITHTGCELRNCLLPEVIVQELLLGKLYFKLKEMCFFSQEVQAYVASSRCLTNGFV